MRRFLLLRRHSIIADTSVDIYYLSFWIILQKELTQENRRTSKPVWVTIAQIKPASWKYLLPNFHWFSFSGNHGAILIKPNFPSWKSLHSFRLGSENDVAVRCDSDGDTKIVYGEIMTNNAVGINRKLVRHVLFVNITRLINLGFIAEEHNRMFWNYFQQAFTANRVISKIMQKQFLYHHHLVRTELQIQLQNAPYGMGC